MSKKSLSTNAGRDADRKTIICMLHYLGLEEAEGVDRSALGARLSVEALSELGDPFHAIAEARRARTKDTTMPWTRAPRAGDDPTSSPSSSSDTDDEERPSPEGRHYAFRRDAGGGAIARHLATFRFQQALDDAASTSHHHHQQQQQHLTPLDPSRGASSSSSNNFDRDCHAGLLSVASAREAAAYAVQGAAAAFGGGLQHQDSPPWSPEEQRPSFLAAACGGGGGGGLSKVVVGTSLRWTENTSTFDPAPKKKSAALTPALGVPYNLSQDPAVLQPPMDLYPRTASVATLHAAITRGDASAVKVAAEAGAAGKGSRIGAFVTMARALHIAAARDGAFGAARAGMIELLVSMGADVCAPDALGATPLHIAAACGNLSALAALLRCASSKSDEASSRPRNHHHQQQQNNEKKGVVADGADDARGASASSTSTSTPPPTRSPSSSLKDDASRADDAARTAAARRCHAGLTPLEVALTRRRDARELFASLLSQTCAFEVDFGPGPLGIKLALVRNSYHHAPAAAATQRTRHHRLHSDGVERRAKAHHRRSRSHDETAVGDDWRGRDAPRTLLVSSVSTDSASRHDLEAGDQLLALNGVVVPVPDEDTFQNLTAAIKTLPRPLRATFVAGSFPHLSVEDDPCIELLERFSPGPQAKYVDDLSFPAP